MFEPKEEMLFTSKEIVETIEKISRTEKGIDDKYLVLNPKHKETLKESDIDIPICWNIFCDEDKAFLVTDKWVAEELRRVRG